MWPYGEASYSAIAPRDIDANSASISGKSSLMLLLLRLIDPSRGSGDITIDGLSLKSIKASVLRSRIISLPQTSFLLPEGNSVRSNMIISDAYHQNNLEDSALDGECRYAISAVGLLAVLEEKGGLDSELNPETLSKGQKQLFCLARAILRARLRLRDYEDARNKPPRQEPAAQPLGGLLLLDEFTASVDLETDKLMQAIIRREFASYTVICVTHRVRTVENYDRVVVMDAGSIVDIGSPRDVISSDGDVVAREAVGVS